MFCPLCKAEYREGFHRCAECDVDLVDSLVKENMEEDDKAELVWRGSDPVAVSRVLGSLRGAGIPYFVKQTSEHLVFGLAIARPRYHILVPRSHFYAAQYLVAPISETLPFESSQPAPDAEKTAVASEESQSLGPAEDWHPKQATLEVWAGTDAGTTEALGDCLRENGIGFRLLADDERQHILVRPEDKKRAREIVREVIEGSPPA